MISTVQNSQNETQEKRPKIAAKFAPVLADAAYPLELLRSITGLDGWAVRNAQRNGLRTVTVGRRKFVLGADFIAYLKLLSDKPEQTASHP